MDNKKLLPDGIYKFKVTHCNCNYVSKAGNKSIKLELTINYKEEPYKIHDYITKKLDPATGKPYQFVILKVKNLVKCINKPHLEGKILENGDLLGTQGYASIKTFKSDDMYRDTNKVFRFLSPEDCNKAFDNNEVLTWFYCGYFLSFFALYVLNKDKLLDGLPEHP